MTNSEIQEAARVAFNNKNYSSAFQTLWKLGVSNFIAFAKDEIIEIAKSEGKGKKKFNWLTYPCSAKIFWDEFILEGQHFTEIFTSHKADDLLHVYFSFYDDFSPKLETRLAQVFPELFIKAVRVNQAFLKEGWIENLCSVELDEKYCLHQKVWRELFNAEQTLWKNITYNKQAIENYSFEDILYHCIIWLETKRFESNTIECIHHLASVYSFFIELILSDSNIHNKAIDSPENLHTGFQHLVTNSYYQVKIQSHVIMLLDSISAWINNNQTIISIYSFDLTYVPVQLQELILIKSTAGAFYKWLLNGVRYEANRINYYFKGKDLVEHLEQKGEIKIPENDKLEKESKCLEFATLYLLHDLGFENFKLKNGKAIETEIILKSLVTYSIKKINQYDSARENVISYGYGSQPFIKFIQKLKEPSFLMFEAGSNKVPLELPEDSKNEVIQLFKFKPGNNFRFNRFNLKYDVWTKPFITIGIFNFCPMIFIANNNWFYSFTNNTLTYRNTNRNETREMEEFLGREIEKKNWTVKVITDKEANAMHGDVDIIVADNDACLFIQLKRPYFRLDLKSAHNELSNSDEKAARQLDDAEKYLSNKNPVYDLKFKPTKWIVSSSFENIGEEFNKCRKINYFEIIHSLKKPEIKTLKDLINYLESDMYIKDFVNNIYNPELTDLERQLIFDNIPVELFQFNQYCISLYSENEKATEKNIKLFNEALSFNRAGMKKEAISLLDEYLLQKPNDGEAYSALANIYADLQLFEESYKNFTKALEIFPDDPFISRNFALALMQGGRPYDGFILLINLYEMFPLILDIKATFEENFIQSVKYGQLNKKEELELLTKWDSLN